MARPSLLNEAVKLQIIRMYEDGATDAYIAKVFGVNIRTVENWKKSCDKFFLTIKDAKEFADESVEVSLYQRAAGYSCRATKIFCDKNGRVVTHEYMEHYPPDPTSMIFWLKNRQPEKWKDKREMELPEGAAINITIDSKDAKF